MRLARGIRAGEPQKNVFTFLSTLVIFFHLAICFRKLEAPGLTVILVLQLAEAADQILRSFAEHNVNTITIDQSLRIVRFEFTELTDINLGLFRRIGLQAELNQSDQNLVGLRVIVHLNINILRIFVAFLLQKSVGNGGKITD